MEINLSSEQLALLDIAVGQHNTFYSKRDEKYYAISVEEYIKQLVDKQIAGLSVAIEYESATAEVQATRLEAARNRLGLK